MCDTNNGGVIDNADDVGVACEAAGNAPADDDDDDGGDADASDD